MGAWARLYQTMFPAIFRRVCFLTGDVLIAEDLVQETFARALVALETFDGRSSFSTWLHAIAFKVVHKYWRKNRNAAAAYQRLTEAVAAGVPPGTAPDDGAVLNRRVQMLYAVLERLPEHLREAFILRDFEGLTPAEAAAQLGISPGNLSVRATRARAQIRTMLEELGWLPNVEVE